MKEKSKQAFSNISDIDIIGRVLQGDRGAYSMIVERYQSYLYRAAFAFLGSREEAEDALQEIFIKAYRYLNTFKLGMNFKTWLYTIAINHLRRLHKKNSRIIQFQTAESEFLEGLPDQKESSDPAIKLLKNQTETDVVNAVNTLKKGLKEVVILYYFDEMSIEEISEILGLGKENIKSKLFRARKILRKIFEKNETVVE